MPWWAEPQRHTLVNVCVCVPQESCLHFLHNHCKLKDETCSASLIQYYLEIELVNCGLEALLSSCGIICSP